MKRISARRAADEGGATAIEYGLIAGAVALAIVTAYWTAGDSLRAGLSEVASAIGLEEQDRGAGGTLFQTRRERH